MRAALILLFTACLSGAASAQTRQTPSTASASPAFELADVHRRPAGSTRQPFFRAGRFEARRATLLNLITFAYEVPVTTVWGGPNFLDFDPFDVVASAPASTPPETMRLMLQALLRDRFNLAVHREDKPEVRYALVVGSGKLRMTPSDGSTPQECRSSTPPGTVVQEFVCRNAPMSLLTSRFNGSRSGYIDAPIVDATELTGTWDASFAVTPSSARAASGDGPSIFDAAEQLGLKVERREIPTPMLVVDRVSAQPTPTPAGVAARLAPPAIGEFEVASVKPLGSGVTGPPQSLQNRRLTLRAPTLRQLVQLAWDTNSVTGDAKVLDAQRFEIIADVPESVPLPIDIDTVRPLLRTLLKSRFDLVVREDTQRVDTYVLTAQKQIKMERGIDRRGGCKSTPERIPPNSGLSAAITCENVTMAQLVDRLPGMAPNYIERHPVVNETGLDGTWNFLVLWTGLAQINGRVNALQPGDKDDALSQPGTYTLFESLEKLGLKLTLMPRPMPALIVDRAQAMPKTN